MMIWEFLNMPKSYMSKLSAYQRYLIKAITIAGIITLISLIFYSYFCFLCFFWQTHFELAWNESTSLAPKLFLVVKNMPVTRGNYVAFYPPPNPLYGSKTPFLKVIGGIAGDVVSKKGREFYVNGLDMGYAHLKAKNGRTLYPGPTGVIGHDDYYVYTNNPRSYDSRYKSIGWIPKSSIEGRAFPVFSGL